jgi:hypothetical protein
VLVKIKMFSKILHLGHATEKKAMATRMQILKVQVLAKMAFSGNRRDLPDLPTFTKLFCEDSPDWPTFPKPCCETPKACQHLPNHFARTRQTCKRWVWWVLRKFGKFGKFGECRLDRFICYLLHKTNYLIMHACANICQEAWQVLAKNPNWT